MSLSGSNPPWFIREIMAIVCSEALSELTIITDGRMKELMCVCACGSSYKMHRILSKHIEDRLIDRFT